MVVGDDVWPVHLAARLGLPTIVLLPSGADWLWGPQPGPSPWYQSAEVLPAGDAAALESRLALLLSRPLPHPLEHHVQHRDDEDAEYGGREHAAEHGACHGAAAGGAGAFGDHQRQQAQDEGEAGHDHRPEAQPRALDRRVEELAAMSSLLDGELDDQDAVLGGQRHQHDQADLGIDVEGEAQPPHEGDGAQARRP